MLRVYNVDLITSFSCTQLRHQSNSSSRKKMKTKMNHVLLLVLAFGALNLVQGIPSPLSAKDHINSIVKTAGRPTCRSALSECIKSLDSGKAETCETLPVPPRSFLKQIAPGTFDLPKLRKNVWMYNDGAYLSLIILKGKRLVLVDFPDSQNSNTDSGSGTLLTDAIQQILGETVPRRIDMVYSHAHLDHIGAAKRVFEYASAKFPDAKVVVWGTKESKDLVVTHKSDRAVPVTELVRKGGRTIKLGRDLELKLMIVGGHTQEDLVVFIPKARGQKGIALYVDVVFPRWSMPFNLAITQDIGEMVSAQRKIMELDFDVLVPGHLRRGTKKDIRMNLDYLEDLLATTKELVGNTPPEALVEAGVGKTQDPSKREFQNIFYAFFLTRKLEIDSCYRTLIEKWACKLAGLDLFLRGHCFVALTYNLTDA